MKYDRDRGISYFDGVFLLTWQFSYEGSRGEMHILLRLLNRMAFTLRHRAYCIGVRLNTSFTLAFSFFHRVPWTAGTCVGYSSYRGSVDKFTTTVRV